MEKVVIVCVSCLLTYLLLIVVVECTSILLGLYSKNVQSQELIRIKFREFVNNSYSREKFEKNYTSYENGLNYSSMSCNECN